MKIISINACLSFFNYNENNAKINNIIDLLNDYDIICIQGIYKKYLNCIKKKCKLYNLSYTITKNVKYTCRLITISKYKLFATNVVLLNNVGFLDLFKNNIIMINNINYINENQEKKIIKIINIDLDLIINYYFENYFNLLNNLFLNSAKVIIVKKISEIFNYINIHDEDFIICGNFKTDISNINNILSKYNYLIENYKTNIINVDTNNKANTENQVINIHHNNIYNENTATIITNLPTKTHITEDILNNDKDINDKDTKDKNIFKNDNNITNIEVLV